MITLKADASLFSDAVESITSKATLFDDVTPLAKLENDVHSINSLLGGALTNRMTEFLPEAKAAFAINEGNQLLFLVYTQD